jgi:hypothetical protein
MPRVPPSLVIPVFWSIVLLFFIIRYSLVPPQGKRKALGLIISTVAVILGSLGRVVRPLLPDVPFILTCSWFPMCFAVFALGGYLIFTDSGKA